MCTNVDHNYGTAVDGIPPLLAVPLSGRVKITVKDSQGESSGETSATQQGEWRETFCLDDGNYTVEFEGNFRPIGSGFNAIYNPPIGSLSLPITVPLIPVPEDPDLVGPEGPMGPEGPAGPTGVDGADGETGATGEIGADGETGTEGAIGLSGAKGDRGSTGSAGSVGPAGSAGPVGVAGSKGLTGATGATGATGPSGDSCTIDIGTPADGYLSDGLLSWAPTTKVCEALDDVNEILSELAPATPLSLTGASLTMSGVTLFDGNASDKGYQNYKSAAGEDVDATYVGGKIVIADTFTLTNPTVGDSEAGGDDTFYPGDEGTLSSRITADGLEEEQGSIDLVTGSPSYDLSLTLNAQNAGYNSFTPWVRGDATIDADTYLSAGYNKIIMRHNVDSSDRDSADYEVFYDDVNASLSFDSVQATTELSAVIRELSGIRHYSTGSTWTLTFGMNVSFFKNVYQTDAFNWTLTAAPGGTISLADAAWDGTIATVPHINDAPTLGGTTNFVMTMSVTSIRAIVTTTVLTFKKPGKSDSPNTSVAVDRLVDTFSDSSTVLDEPFDDENYRLPDYDGAEYPDNFDTVPGSLTGNWDSTADLVDGEAAVFQGSLYHGASSSLPNGGDFTLTSPSGSPDYSGFTADAIYTRAFEDDGDPHNNGILELAGLSASDVSPLGSGNINVEMKLPTETGWLDLGSIFNVALFTGVDGDGCQTAQSGDDWSFTFGTFSTANSEFTVIVRITIRNTTSVISRMRITDW